MLDVILNCIYSRNNFIVVCGDFNTDFSVTGDNSSSLVQLFRSFGMGPLVNWMTRVTANSASRIDNVFTNIDQSHLMCRNVTTFISDHYGQLTTIQTPTSHSKVNYKRKRFFNDTNIFGFCSYLEQESWADLEEYLDVNSKYECFFPKFLLLF